MRETNYRKPQTVGPPAWRYCWLQACGKSQVRTAGTMTAHPMT